MKAIINHFGGLQVLITASTEKNIDLVHPVEIIETSANKPVKHEELTEIVTRIAESVSKSFNSIKEHLPNETQIEFSLAFSEKMDLWAIGAASSQGIKLTLKWNR